MSINRLVTSAILLIALLVVSSGGYIEITKLFTVRQLATSALRLDAIRALGNIPRYLNPERALFTLALQTAPPGEHSKSAELLRVIGLTDAAMAAAESEVAAIQGRLDDAAEIRAEMSEVSKLFKQYRDFGDEKLRLPIDQRGDPATTMIGQKTQSNAAMVEETTAATHRLLEESNALLEAVAAFHVSEIGPIRTSAHEAPRTARGSAPIGARETAPLRRGATAA